MEVKLPAYGKRTVTGLSKDKSLGLPPPQVTDYGSLNLTIFGRSQRSAGGLGSDYADMGFISDFIVAGKRKYVCQNSAHLHVAVEYLQIACELLK